MMPSLSERIDALTEQFKGFIAKFSADPSSSATPLKADLDGLNAQLGNLAAEHRASQAESAQLAAANARLAANLTAAEASNAKLQADLTASQSAQVDFDKKVEEAAGKKAALLQASLGVLPVNLKPGLSPTGGSGSGDLLAQYNQISDPVERAQFFKKNKEAFAAAQRVQRD